MPFYICDIRECSTPSVRKGCSLCNRHLCATHITSNDHSCLNTDDKMHAFARSTERDITALLSRINVEALRARASTLRDGVSCTIPLLSYDAETSWDVMGGMNYHVNITFEDGVVWLCRVRRRDASSPPTVLQNRILLSEAATLRYLSTISVPVPKVYDAVADSPSNPVGVGYILMEKLQGKSLDWFDLDRDGKSKILEQLAQIYIALEKHTFPAIGCLEEGGVVGQLVNSAAADVDAVGHLQLLGPFATPFEYRYTLALHQLAIIGNGEVYASNAHAVDAYLVHRYLLDHMSLFVQQDEAEKPGYYLKHMDDKGDHILVDEALNIVGVVDWEWAQTTSKCEAFAAPIFLLDVLAYFKGKSELSDDELLFASILESQGRYDLASFVRKGRVEHQLAFCIGGDYESESFQTLFSGLRASLQIAKNDDPKVDWELWRKEALTKYRDEPVLQALMSDL